MEKYQSAFAMCVVWYEGIPWRVWLLRSAPVVHGQCDLTRDHYHPGTSSCGRGCAAFENTSRLEAADFVGSPTRFRPARPLCACITLIRLRKPIKNAGRLFSAAFLPGGPHTPTPDHQQMKFAGNVGRAAAIAPLPRACFLRIVPIWIPFSPG